VSEPTEVSRRLVAVFAADVEGYSRLMGADEVGTLKGLTERRAILDKAIAEHRGRIANTAGDSVLAEFGSAVDAVQCAVEAQAALAEANSSIPSDKRINFRIGVHVGDVMVRAGDLFGDGVNIAARLQTLAQPGSVCVSGATYDQVRKIVPVQFTDLGPQRVKNIEEPVKAYAVRTVSNAVAAPSTILVAEAPKPLPLPDKPSIAVLPFQNMSGDPEQEYFADGVVEEITTALSRFKSLFVIARNSSFTYKGKAVDIKQVGRELGVRYVLEGSVRRAGGRVRITGQLIDAITGTHLWADRFEGALDDIFDLQDQVTASVAGAIVPKLEQAEIERATRKPTESLDAYDFYLRAIVNHYPTTSEANDTVLQLLHKAIELDPRFAAAHGLAAWCYGWRKTQGWTTNLARETAEAVRLARRAVELGKDDALALAWGGYSLGQLVGELDDGSAFIDQALALNPNLAAAWHVSGLVRVWRGEPDLAIEHFMRAMRLSPLDLTIAGSQYGTALAHFFADRYGEASLWVAKALRGNPNFLAALRLAAAANSLAGRMDDAQRAMDRLLQLEPTRRISNLKEVTVRWRRPEDFAKYVEGLRRAGMPE